MHCQGPFPTLSTSRNRRALLFFQGSGFGTNYLRHVFLPTGRSRTTAATCASRTVVWTNGHIYSLPSVQLRPGDGHEASVLRDAESPDSAPFADGWSPGN